MVKAALPPAAVERLREARARIRDKRDAVIHPGLPPSELRLVISPLWLDFERSGQDQVEFFKEVTCLEPDDAVLDIGCGVGRVALPLSKYLSNGGTYEGFDLEPDLVAWCQRHIQADRPNFRFTYADLTTSYLPGRKYSAENFQFPYASGSFDLVYAGSVFTHMLPQAAENYLAETARVLKPDGRSSLTWLLYSRGLSAAKLHRSVEEMFPHDFEYYKIRMLERPEERVAYDLAWMRSAYERNGLTIIEPLRGDVTYSSVRAPDPRTGAHLHYAYTVIAVPS